MCHSQAHTSHTPLNHVCHTTQKEKDNYAVIFLLYNHCLCGDTLYCWHVYQNPLLPYKEKNTYKILSVIYTNLCKIYSVIFLLCHIKNNILVLPILTDCFTVPSKLLHVLIILLPMEQYLNIYTFSWDPNAKVIYTSTKSNSQESSGTSWSFKQYR